MNNQENMNDENSSPTSQTVGFDVAAPFSVDGTNMDHLLVNNEFHLNDGIQHLTETATVITPLGSYNNNNNIILNAAASTSNQETRKVWKQYKRYTNSDINAAIQCVRGGMSALQASRKYGVPSRTLYDKVKKLGINRPNAKRGRRNNNDELDSAAFPYTEGFGRVQTVENTASTNLNATAAGYGADINLVTSTYTASSLSNLSNNIQELVLSQFRSMVPFVETLQQALVTQGDDIVERERMRTLALAAATANWFLYLNS